METVKDFAQIVYYLTLSIAGPLALIEYFKAKKRDRVANEYKVYDELNNRFFEYQKIALEYYDLDILDVPNGDPSLSFDKKRKQDFLHGRNNRAGAAAFRQRQLALTANAITAAAIAALRLSARPAIGIFTSRSHSASYSVGRPCCSLPIRRKQGWRYSASR